MSVVEEPPSASSPPHPLIGRSLAGWDQRLAYEPIRLHLPSEEADGMLVFWGGRLAAVLCRIAPDRLHEDELWFVECGLGGCEPPPGGLTFDQLEAALRWVGSRCAMGPTLI